jgi:membrane protein YqaA with SNARE-associated domain
MERFVSWMRALATTLGAPGLFIVGFLDSSVLSLPEIADLLVVYMVTRHKARLIVYAVSTTLGSLAGCLVLYYLGRKGGDALIRKRFATASVDRTMKSLQRHGVVAVLIASILPPPAPFKVFVLLAGAAHITAAKFVMAVTIGRGSRYLTLGILAVWYGDRAAAYVREHATAVSLATVGVLTVAFAAYLWWIRAQTRRTR